MAEDLSRRIVRFDLLTSCISVAMGLMLTFALEIGYGDIAVGTAVALLTAVFVAGADRSRRGVLAFVLVGALSIAGLLAVIAGIAPTETESLVLMIIPGGMIGLGVGQLANRVLFGIVWSVPEARVERGFGWSR